MLNQKLISCVKRQKHTIVFYLVSKDKGGWRDDMIVSLFRGHPQMHLI